MTYTPRGYSDWEYLHKATDFLTYCRREAPLGGLWDMGDLQWWWRDDQYGDPTQQMFWEGKHGSVVGLVLLSKSYRDATYELLPSIGQGPMAQEVVSWGLNSLREMAASASDSDPYTICIRDDHSTFVEMAEHLGFRETGEALVQTVLDVRRGVHDQPMPEGYEVRSIRPADEIAGGPPVLDISPAMLGRVRNTPSYREDMHLVVVTPDEQIAAECICWIDQVSKVGLFEPVRTVEEFQRRGLGRAMMAEGLRRMTAEGVSWAKVSHYRSNIAAAALYRSVGCHEVHTRRFYSYDVQNNQ